MGGENENTGGENTGGNGTAGEELNSANWEELSPDQPGLDDSSEDDTTAFAVNADDSAQGSDDVSPKVLPKDKKVSTDSVDGEAGHDTEGEGSKEKQEGEADGEGDQAESFQAPKEKTPEEIAAQQAEYDKWVNGQRTALKEVYKLTDDQADRMQTEPELVIPEMLAEMHLNVQRSIFEGLKHVVPETLQKAVESDRQEKAARNAFYSEWPELKAHHEEVIKVGKLYRQMNPKASPEKAIKAIGLLVSQQLDIPVKTSTGKAAEVKPPRPAKPGAQAAPAKKSGGNEWENLIDDE